MNISNYLTIRSFYLTVLSHKKGYLFKRLFLGTSSIYTAKIPPCFIFTNILGSNQSSKTICKDKILAFILINNSVNWMLIKAK